MAHADPGGLHARSPQNKDYLDDFDNRSGTYGCPGP